MFTTLKWAFANNPRFLAFGVFFLAACSADPNKQKLKYLHSGETYCKDGRYQEAAIQFRNAVQIDPKFADAHFQLALAYLSLGNRETAYHELQETVALDPKRPDAQLKLAALLIARREYKQAGAAAAKALSADPKSSKAHAILGEKYALTRDVPNAILEFQKAIDLDPTRVEYYASLGAIYLSAGQPSAAEAAYSQAIAANPKSVSAHVALGEFYFSQGETAEAGAQMRAGSEVDRRAVLPRLLLARIFVTEGKLADAERVCAELKTMVPEDPQGYQALGLFYASTGQKEKAAAEFQSLLASRPKDNLVKAQLIESLLDLHRIKEAAALDQELLRTNPTDPRGLLSNGRILIAGGKYREAVVELEKAINSDPGSARSHYFLGLAQKSLGLSNLAKASFSRALELNRRMTEARVAVADLSANNGDYDGALRLANDALKADPNSSSANVIKAKILLAQGDLRQGEALLLAALEGEPTSLPALATLVSLYARQGRAQEAVQRISRLVALYPKNAGLHLLLAVGYFDLKDLEKSEASAREAIAIDPRTPEAYTLMADIDYAKGAVEKAKVDLRKAIEVNPRNVANYMALGSWYAKDGNWEDAKKLCEKAHDVDPASPLVANQLAFLYLEHGGDVNIALSLAQAAKQKMPDSAPVADTLGWAYYKLGSPGSAVVQLKESVQKAPYNPVYKYHLGMAHLAAGDRQSAERLLQQALKRNPNFAYAVDARAALGKLSKARN